MMASRLNRSLIARAIRVRRSHHHSQFFNTFYFTLSLLCSGVWPGSGQWPNGSSSISLAALTIPANYFPCRVIFLGCSLLQNCSRCSASLFQHLLASFISISPSLSLSLSLRLSFLLLYRRNSRPHHTFDCSPSLEVFIVPISLWVL